jgi:hypothetical protein
VRTLDRLLGALGVSLEAAPLPGGRTRDELALAGERLAEVLALAEELPFRRARELRFPRLPA